ncbi:pyridoxamine 5'-phosphate oxidase family protein [Ulvibacterium sp.]|uniref:pyridoxamine 5'-phosphate oxidase family protein n=1 Tax=Ulvibacterium sp. TaxID=2665914 RepID=UPI0026049491|nr:pyridoxamine 5'-phosphate oxidase family protein [Ulvibacterium sp.]
MSRLTPRLIDFIRKQHLFFVATAMKDGHINLSPKGLDSLKVINENRVLWLNLTGSGNETATHLMHNERMTLMFCAFEGPPMILRLYGSARACHPHDSLWEESIDFFPNKAGARQLIDLHIELVQISCGFGVPLMDYRQQRQELVEWAESQGEEGLRKYRERKNTTSLDGHTTDISNTTKP